MYTNNYGVHNSYATRFFDFFLKELPLFVGFMSSYGIISLLDLILFVSFLVV